MTFLWPWLLLLPAVTLPALVSLWLLSERRVRSRVVEFTNLDLIDQVVPRPAGPRRFLPLALVFLGISALLVGSARPALRVRVAEASTSVMLAIDVSLSMEADDFEPSRLEAAKSAAARFLDRAPDNVEVGLVAFSGVARVLLPPTRDHEAVRTSLDRLLPDQGTAIGEGIWAAMEATERGRNGPGTNESPGSLPSSSILLLSDGENTVGRDPVEVARDAAITGIPVSTVAIGTDRGLIEVRGTPIIVTVNEAQLREIAAVSGGEFYRAENAGDLSRVYEGLGSRLAKDIRTIEITVALLLLGAFIVIGSVLVGLFWVRRFP